LQHLRESLRQYHPHPSDSRIIGKTGIGKWSDAQLIKAIREGICRMAR